jgi:hypothetical protein
MLTERFGSRLKGVRYESNLFCRRLVRGGRFRRNLVVGALSGKGPFTHSLQTSIVVQRKPAAC